MADTRPISEVRIWSVQDRRSNPKYERPWIVRWAVDGKKFQKAHRTKAEADRYRSQLFVAQSSGLMFDASTGEPIAWTKAESDVSVHEWARTWLAGNWSEWQPRTRTSPVSDSRSAPRSHARLGTREADATALSVIG